MPPLASSRVPTASPCASRHAEGEYALHADWLLACDGARSLVRRAMGLPFAGQVFQDRFLIADVVMKADFPTERWFWFDPPFHRGQSALLHKQPDGVWRIDLQLGRDADPEREREPERVIPRIRAMLGEDVPFELEWVSVYTFRCRRLERFVHGRVVFVGDSARTRSAHSARAAATAACRMRTISAGRSLRCCKGARPRAWSRPTMPSVSRPRTRTS